MTAPVGTDSPATSQEAPGPTSSASSPAPTATVTATATATVTPAPVTQTTTATVTATTTAPATVQRVTVEPDQFAAVIIGLGVLILVVSYMATKVRG